MIYDQVPPTEKDWTSGTNLWTLDILAPFGHSKLVARHIARTPSEGPFCLARLGKGGRTHQVMRGDASVRKNRVHSFHLDTEKDSKSRL